MQKKMRLFFKVQKQNANKSLTCHSAFQQTFIESLLWAKILPGIVYTLGGPCLHGTHSLVEKTDNQQVNRIINCVVIKFSEWKEQSPAPRLFLVLPYSLRYLSSPTRDWTWALAVKALSPSHRPARESPEQTLKERIMVGTYFKIDGQERSLWGSKVSCRMRRHQPLWWGPLQAARRECVIVLKLESC